MKKVFFMLLLGVGVTAFAQDKAINYSQLPKNGQSFISSNFGAKSVSQVTLDDDVLSKEYKVYLANGTKVEFDGKGNWKEIDGNTTSVSPKFLAKNIQTYITSNYPKIQIKKIERDSKKIEVKLVNDIELIFDKKGKFVKIDD